MPLLRDEFTVQNSGRGSCATSVVVFGHTNIAIRVADSMLGYFLLC
jgi:hypothetical protein